MSQNNARTNQLKEANQIQMRDGGLLLRSLQDGTEIPLDKRSSLVGRELECEISLDSGHISRYHAKLTLMDDGVQVEDLNSTNGTFVNGRRIKRPEFVAPGDEIRFHEIGFQLVCAEDSMMSDVTLIDSLSYPETLLSDAGLSDFNFSEDYEEEAFGASERGAESLRPRPEAKAKAESEPSKGAQPNRGQSARARKKAAQNAEQGRLQSGNNPQGGASGLKITEAKLEEARRKAAQLAAARANANVMVDAQSKSEGSAAHSASVQSSSVQLKAEPAHKESDNFKAPPGFARSRDVDKDSMAVPDLSAHLTRMPGAQEEEKKVSTAELLVKLNQQRAAAKEEKPQPKPNLRADDAKELAALMPELRRAKSDKPATGQKPASSPEHKVPETPKQEPEAVNPFAGLLEDAPPEPLNRKPQLADASPAKNPAPAKGERIEPNFDDDTELMDVDDFNLLQDRAERMVTSPDNGSGPRMVMLTAPVRGKVFSLVAKNKNTWMIGRGQEADFRILDKTVSPSHARIRKLGADWVLEANDGQNPMAINNRPVEFSTLQPGDVVRIGRMEMIFRVDHKSVAPAKKEPVLMASGLNLGLLVSALVILGVILGVLLV